MVSGLASFSSIRWQSSHFILPKSMVLVPVAGLRLKLVDNKGEQDDELFAAEAAIPVSKSLSPASEDRSDEPYDSDSQRHKDGIMEPANGRQPLNHILW